jgi:hypothetical protein
MPKRRSNGSTNPKKARGDGAARLAPSCPHLSRASTSSFLLEIAKQSVDGRNEIRP